MKAIRTAPGVGVDQRSLQVVFAKKPGKSAHRRLWPVLAIVRATRGEARGYRRGGLDRLLVERFGLVANPAKAFGANGPEAAGWRGLE
jgi:hypothetical protein